jgi:hypothetical protein
MSSYRILIFENVSGDSNPHLRETRPITANDENDAIAEAKKTCRIINDPSLIKRSGRIPLTGFEIRDEADDLVYKSTHTDMP